jgi:hypothetical protein
MGLKDYKRISKPFFYGHHNNLASQSMMFTEDFGRALLKDTSSISISVNNEKIEEIFSNFQSHSFRNSYKNGFKESIKDIIQLMTNELIHNGRIAFELISKDNEEDLIYNLVNVKGTRLKKLFFNLKQVTIDDGGVEMATYIPRGKCVIIDFPKILGGRKKYLKFLSEFNKLSISDPIHIFNNKLMGTSRYYDSINHHKKLEIELRRKSSPYKWHHRDNLGNNDLFLEFYYNLKTLEFMKTRAQLRDYVFDELNRIIKFVSKKLQIENAPILQFENIISVCELERITEDYKVGKVGRRIIIDLISKI